MLVETTDFCLAILDRGTPLGIDDLLNRARKYKLGLRDYAIRRAIRSLQDERLVHFTRTNFSPALIYDLTPEGKKRAKANRRLVRLIFKRYVKEEKPAKNGTVAPKQPRIVEEGVIDNTAGEDD
jgi:hypothetical protein